METEKTEQLNQQLSAARDDVQIRFDRVSYSYYAEEEEEEETEKNGIRTPAVLQYAVENASFTICKGEMVAVVGRNGSGKSTLARLMNVLLLPVTGTVFVDGISTEQDEMVWEIRSRVGMVFQNPDNQIIGSTVEEDVAFGLENLGVPRPEMLERIQWATETVGIAAQRETEPHLLSGGQKQRVAIAGILAMRPECIVLDEATAMLDPVGRREVMRVVRRLNRENGITIVHITHHMDEVSLCDRAVLVNRGVILLDDSPHKLFAQPALLREAGLEAPQVTQLFQALREAGIEVPDDVLTVDEALPLLRERLEKSGKRFSEEEKTAREERRRLRRTRYTYREGPHSLRAEHLFYTYGRGTPFEKKALSDVSVSIGDGEFVGIIGHTGCGKSTLVQHFNGLLKPDSGCVYIGGGRVDSANVKEMRRRVGLVFQYPEYQLFESTVEKDIAFGLRCETLSEEESHARVLEAARIVGLPETLLDQSIYDLSGGQKRRAAIAGVLVMKPNVLILDEPAAGLDPAGRDEILQFCRELREKHGITVVLVSHSMEDVARLCDRVLVMNHGTAEACAAPETVFEQEKHLEEIGLSVPQLSALFHRLREALPELGLSGKIYTVEDGTDELCAFLGKEVAP